ncbi:ATP-binding SpoIIE family protein phosphatase [Kineococcus sp. SYSU DK002]|uniref:ATP-binding SpoIIE family protein phosphatase n=1 Tax=Kineococcus sp. SYSU DK002 TaxID=3383123 RepID=UPI003D7F086C
MSTAGFPAGDRPGSTAQAAPPGEGVWQAVAQLALALSEVTTLEELVGSFTRLGVPVLSADGCGVITAAHDGGWQLALSTSFTSALRARFLYEPRDSPLPACRAARDGEAFFLADPAAARAVHPRMQEVVEVTGRQRWALLPLTAGSETVGSLAVSWERAGAFTHEERWLLQVVAAHVAPTVERLLRTDAEHRAHALAVLTAGALQDGVLQAPPDVEGVELAVSYRPAGPNAVIGGDWYDVVTRRAGDTLVVVGDIAGHDRHASAGMVQTRAVFRGIAWDSSDGPARLLDRLDAAVAALQPGTTATAVLVRLERTGAGFGLRWASAGHPPPLLRLPDGSVEVLADGEDPLLGVDWSSPRREHRHPFPEGSVLVLVTDGVFETRDVSAGAGVRALAAALAEAGPGDAEEICSRLVRWSSTTRPPAGTSPREGTRTALDDDRTLLVVRARGAEASPPAASRAGASAPPRAGGAGPGPVAPPAGGSDGSAAAVTRVVSLPPEARSTPVARSVVRSVALTGGWDGDAVDVAELLVSEVVTNAVIHGRSDIRMCASSTPDRLLVEVEDGNDRLPELLPADSEALSGRGLQLLEFAADDWGARRVDGHGAFSKVVWFSIDRDR